MSNLEQAKPTVVLVHAAWSDGSSWSRVIPRLRAEGLSVIAPQLPLSSLQADTVALKKVGTNREGLPTEGQVSDYRPRPISNRLVC